MKSEVSLNVILENYKNISLILLNFKEFFISNHYLFKIFNYFLIYFFSHYPNTVFLHT